MTDDESFLRALLATPADRTARLVYADWLDDRGDPRAEYARLAGRAAEAHDPAARARMLALQPTLPPWWVAIVGGLRVAKDQRPGGSRVEEATRALDRGLHSTDADGYKRELHAAATSGQTGALAYLEQRSKSLPSYNDDFYALVLRDPAGRTAECRPYVYSAYAGCEVRFFEWYGDVVLFLYREKHRTYAIRLGFDAPERSARLSDCWLIDGDQLAFVEYRGTEVKRVSVPDLDPLPALSIEDAKRRDLMPTMPTWWRNG